MNAITIMQLVLTAVVGVTIGGIGVATITSQATCVAPVQVSNSLPRSLFQTQPIPLTGYKGY